MGRLIDVDVLLDKLPQEYIGSTVHGLINEQPTVPQWIPVNIDTEEFPKDDEDVLVIDEDGDYYVAWRSDGRWWERNPFGEDIKDVRAWMPLPRYEGGEQNG